MTAEQEKEPFFNDLALSQERIILNRLHSAATEAAKAIAGLEGIDYCKLDQAEQIRRNLQVIRRAFTEEARLDRMLAERRLETLNERIVVNPGTIELTVTKNGHEKKINVAGQRKEMLAFFADLTEQRISRFLQPLIHIDELVEFSQGKFTRDQLVSHCFDLFTESGIFNVHPNEGYRLNCNLYELFKILASDQPRQKLTVGGIEEWCHFDSLLEDYILPLVLAIWEQRPMNGAIAGANLDVVRLGLDTNRSKNRVYYHLRSLETRGIIQRGGNVYLIKDVAWETVKKIVEANSRPYLTRVFVERSSGKAGYSLFSKMPKRAEPLNLQAQEYPDFPQDSWGKYGLAVNLRQIYPNKENLIKLFEKVLTADLQETVVLDSRRQPVSLDGRMPMVFKLPQSKDFTVEENLAILEFLGFGPEEMKKLGHLLEGSLAATIRRLENSSDLWQELLAAEAKARLVGQIMEEATTTEEGMDLPFAQVVSLLDEALKSKPAVDLTVPKEVFDKEEKHRNEEPEKSEKENIDQKFMGMVEKVLEKELLSALSQESALADELPPTGVFDLHRVLSRKAVMIPWSGLFNLNLARPNAFQHHPGMTAVGALISALYLRESLRCRINKTGEEALRLLSNYVFHILRKQDDKEGIDLKKVRYIENCLNILQKIGLSCSCEECQPA